MTWLWDKVRQSFREGTLQYKIRKFFDFPGEDPLTCSFQLDAEDDHRVQLLDFSEEFKNDLFSYMNICNNCTLIVNQHRNFDLSTSELKAPQGGESVCPLCRFSLANSFLTASDNQECHEFAREQRSVSEPNTPSYHFPHLPNSSHIYGDHNATNTLTEDNDDHLGIMLLSFNSRIPFVLPPLLKRNLKRFTLHQHNTRDSTVELMEIEDHSSSPDNKWQKRNNRHNSILKVSSMNQFNRKMKTRQEFLRDVRKACHKENYNELLSFYAKTFSTFNEICFVFKQELIEPGATLEDPGLNMEFVYSVNDAVTHLPSTIEKTILKAIINALMQESKVKYEKDEIRAVFILLQCPVFSLQHSYIVFAHLLRYCINLPTRHHQYLVQWFKVIDVEKLRSLIRQLMQFITVRQFSTFDKFLPSMNKSRWWIPTATKVLALINAANNDSSPPLLHYTEFYNSALDHIDIMQDYYIWQNCKQSEQFAYCQYPFILSILAKRFILTKDSEQQMIINARKSLVAKMTRRQTPQIDVFFLNIRVRRSHLVSDSLNEITSKQRDLKKKLKVSFVDEPGLDMGGLTKEWFLLLVRDIFDVNYGMFVYHAHSHCYWFSTNNKNRNLREYNLIGVLMGLAVYNSNILDLHFPSVCYRKLLTPPVVPNANSNHQIGIIEHPGLDDLSEIMPTVARSLKEILEYKGNIEEDMGITFQISVEEFNEIKTFELKPNGKTITVTNENRIEYVECYLNWILNTAIYEQFKAFYLGFHSVCASNALIMLRGEEVEMLVCGLETLDLSELRKITQYDGFDSEEEFIRNFWNEVEMLSQDLKKKFLLFTTGSDRIPVGGLSEMSFKITRLPHKIENLPEAHTCFNQLVLPRYENQVILREKLLTAISNAVGFGLE